LTVTNSWSVDPSVVMNFTLGASNATIAVTGDLNLAGTINVNAGAGFTNGTYTLFTYGSALTWNAPFLGSVPPGYNYTFDTNTVGRVKLTVQATPSLVPPNVAWSENGSQLQLSWPADRIGWHLEVQTNTLTVGLSTNWFTVAGSSGTNAVLLPI